MRFEVMTTAGGSSAAIVPSSGTVTVKSESTSSRNASNSSSARSSSSTAARRPTPARIAREQRPLDEELGPVELARRARSAVDLALLERARVEELARVVPLVERLRRVDALVALEPDQVGVEDARERLRRPRSCRPRPRPRGGAAGASRAARKIAVARPRSGRYDSARRACSTSATDPNAHGRSVRKVDLEHRSRVGVCSLRHGPAPGSGVTGRRRTACIPPGSSTHAPTSARRGALDPRALRRRGEGAGRRPEPDPADEAPLRLAATRSSTSTASTGSTRSRRGRRRPAHRRARPPQGLRALRAPRRAATASSATPRRRSPTRSCATAARSCGSLAHADPQGDWGSALLAAGAELEVARLGRDAHDPARRASSRARSRRALAAERDRRPRSGSPIPGPRAGGTYLKLERKVGDYATVARRRPRSRSTNGTRRPRRDRADRRRPAEHPRRARRGRRSPAPSSNDEAIRRGGAARRRGRAAADDIRGTRRVQAERRPGLHRARAPQGRRRRPGRLRRRR